MIKVFLIRCFILMAAIWLTDQTLYFGLQQYRPVDYKFFLEAKRDFFRKNKEVDIVFFGDSHIADAVDPRIIEIACDNLSAFNLGIYGASPFENYFTFLNVINNGDSIPRAIALGTNAQMFTRPLLPGSYTPLILSSSTIKFRLYNNSREPFKMAYVMKVAQEKHLFTSAMKSILGRTYTPTRDVTEYYNGFLRFENQIDGERWDIFNEKKILKFNPQQLIYFEKIILLAEDMGIKVFIIHPPLWIERLNLERETTHFQEFSDAIMVIGERHGIPIFNHDFRLSEKFLRDDYLNAEHLNNRGAKKFSSELSKWIANQLELCNDR